MKNNPITVSDEIPSDSVTVYLALANADSVPLAKRLNFTKRANAILIGQENDSLNRINFFKVANRYFNLNNLEQYKKTSKLIIERSNASKDTINLAKGYSYLGDYYFYRATDTDSAFYFYLKAQKMYQKLGNNVDLGGIYISMARVKANANDFLGGELMATQGLTVLRETSEKQKVYEAYNILGFISNELKDYEKALESHSKALKLVREFSLDNEMHQAATSLNNIGNVYQNQEKYKEAIANFELGLSDASLYNHRPDLYAILIDNMAYSKFKLKEYDQLPELFYEALKIRDSLNLTSSIVFSKIHLSEYYAERKDTLKAQKLANEALMLSKNSKKPGDILLALKQIVVIEPQNASLYSNEYIKINDSLQQAGRKIKDKFARIQFETDEILLQKEKLAIQNRNLVLLIIGIMMIGLLLFVIRAQRGKNRELLLKQAQQKANEDIYNLMLFQQNKIEEGRIKEKKRIAQELHDGVLGRLFGTRLNLDSLNKMEGDQAMEKRNNFLSELKNIEQDIREISHDLNREKFVLINNFVAILNNLLEEQAALFHVEVLSTIDASIKWKYINNTLKINIYRIIQEALQNTNKYAKATRIQVELKEEEGNLKLKITDNGIGFSLNKKSKGIGLQNMMTRSQECNGIFEVKSKKEKGTIITILFPIENKQITA